MLCIGGLVELVNVMYWRSGGIGKCYVLAVWWNW
jgi:hypothetical protein